MSEPVIQNPRTYPHWVGVVLCILMPGSAHFLSGQKLLGGGLLLGFFGLLLGPFVLLSIPGHFWFIISLSLILAASFVVYYVALLILSYRPVYRLGCFDWLCFLLFLFSFNCLLVIFDLRVALKTYCVEAYVNQGMAMSPTIIAPSKSDPTVQWADCIIVNKWIYRIQKLNRGDIVAFQTEQVDSAGSPVVFVKRIAGLPGETLDIEPPYVLINGERLVAPPIFETISSKQGGYSGYLRLENLGNPSGKGTSLPITLGPDEYFLLGDNSLLSFDSRFWGPVSREKILGKSIRIYWPLSRIRDLE